MITQINKRITPIVLCFLFSIFSASAQLSVNPTITNATCPSDTNGSISVSVSGGTAPYTYQWIPDGQTSPTITGLTIGTYSLTVTDNVGNTTTVSYVVGPLPFSETDQIQAPVCTNNGFILLTPFGGNGGPYQFSWSIGQMDTGTTSSISNIGAGNYSVNLKDANSCTVTFTFDVKEAECFVTPERFFTPNNDGINDTWYIANSQYFENAHVIIFDRWGTRVYEHKGTYEPWDGKSYLGISVPVAVYYYFFYQDKDDKQKQAKSGSVTLMR